MPNEELPVQVEAEALVDSAVKYANTPICLQAVAYRYEEERVVKALEVLSKHLPLRP